MLEQPGNVQNISPSVSPGKQQPGKTSTGTVACLDAQRATDLFTSPVQSTENEALAWLIMAQVYPLR